MYQSETRDPRWRVSDVGIFLVLNLLTYPAVEPQRSDELPLSPNPKRFSIALMTMIKALRSSSQNSLSSI